MEPDFHAGKKQHKKVSHQSDKKGQKNYHLSYTHIISKKGSQIQKKVYQKSVKKDECKYQNLSKIYKKYKKVVLKQSLNSDDIIIIRNSYRMWDHCYCLELRLCG